MMETTGIAPVSGAEALRVLVSGNCACGRRNGVRRAFCRECFELLTPGQQADLYKRIGHGFEKAYAVALQWIREERA